MKLVRPTVDPSQIVEQVSANANWKIQIARKATPVDSSPIRQLTGRNRIKG
jgi:hypothetical protein